MGMGYLGHCCLFRRLHLLLQNTPIHCWINQFVSLTSWLSSSASSPQNWNVVQIVSLPPSLSLVFARAVLSRKVFIIFSIFFISEFADLWSLEASARLQPQFGWSRCWAAQHLNSWHALSHPYFSWCFQMPPKF